MKNISILVIVALVLTSFTFLNKQQTQDAYSISFKGLTAAKEYQFYYRKNTTYSRALGSQRVLTDSTVIKLGAEELSSVSIDIWAVNKTNQKRTPTFKLKDKTTQVLTLTSVNDSSLLFNSNKKR